MAKFVYKMQNILNIKMRLETQAKTEFSQASARLDEEEDKLRSLILRRRTYEDELKNASNDKLDINKLKQYNNYIAVIKELMEKQALQVRIAQKNLDKAREKLNKSMQERKIHEKLREKAFDEFKEELKAEEKKEIDQLVSFTYNDRGKKA